jgi:hypothetical protein
MTMEIDVTQFIQSGSMMDYSASVAEIGADAGRVTWGASVEASEEFNFLPDADALQHFREWLKPWVGWTEEEITDMPDAHLRALCLQWIAGDWRECFDCSPDAADWEDYETRASAGQCQSSFYRDAAGRIFFDLSH